MQIEYNWQRKVWHASGSLFMVALYFSWQGRWHAFGRVLDGLTILTAIAWSITVMLIGIDLLRLSHPRQAESIKKLPLFGRWIRKHEEVGFNSATYFLLGAALVVSARRFGLGSDGLILAAILITGLADPVASTLRYWLNCHSRLNGELCGWLGFTVIGWAFLIYHAQIDWYWSLVISMLTATVEYQMPVWYNRGKMFFTGSKFPFAGKPPGPLSRLYPDDNLVIPVMVYFLAIILATH